MKKTLLVTAITCGLLVGCGGSDEAGDPPITPSNALPANAVEGRLVDSAVANIHYKTDTLSGVTDAQGQYNYLPGESVTFSIGEITFAPVAAAGVVTPLDLAGSYDINNQSVVNISRLLQSLDADGDSSNGISIADAAKSAATVNIDFNVATSEFENNAEVTAFVASHAHGGNLVTANAATTHLEQTLATEGISFGPHIGTWMFNDETTDEGPGTLIMFTFLSDGNYISYEMDSSQGDRSGMLWGTLGTEDGYVYPESKIHNDFEALADQPGVGIFNMAVSPTQAIEDLAFTMKLDGMSADGQTTNFVVAVSGDPSEPQVLPFQRITNQGIYGTWLHTEADDFLLALTFLDNGTYVHAEVDPSKADTEGDYKNGVEWGEFEHNDQNELTITMPTPEVRDLNGTAGLASIESSQPIKAVVKGDVLHLTVNENGADNTMLFYRQ
jgi:hypothetical protein